MDRKRSNIPAIQPAVDSTASSVKSKVEPASCPQIPRTKHNFGGGNTDLTTVSSTGVTLTAGSVYYLLASASPDTEALAWQLSSTDGNHYIYGYDQYGNFYN